MSPAQKRAKVLTAYPGDRWKVKVGKMSDAQVHATYTRMLNSGQFKSYKEKNGKYAGNPQRVTAV